MMVYLYAAEFDGKNGSHLLLEKALRAYGKSTGIFIPEKLTIETGSHGKPYVKELPTVPFSISHSEQYWMCAISDHELGLDLQKEQNRSAEKVSRRFFHEQEKQWLKRQGYNQFSKVWAYKESYVKYTGEGLSRGLDYFSVIDEQGNLTGVSGCSQTEIEVRAGFFCVLTTEEKVPLVIVPVCEI